MPSYYHPALRKLGLSETVINPRTSVADHLNANGDHIARSMTDGVKTIHYQLPGKIELGYSIRVSQFRETHHDLRSVNVGHTRFVYGLNHELKYMQHIGKNPDGGNTFSYSLPERDGRLVWQNNLHGAMRRPVALLVMFGAAALVISKFVSPEFAQPASSSSTPPVGEIVQNSSVRQCGAMTCSVINPNDPVLRGARMIVRGHTSDGWDFVETKTGAGLPVAGFVKANLIRLDQ